MKLIINLVKSILTIPLALSMMEKMETELGEYEFNYEDNVYDIKTGRKV